MASILIRSSASRLLRSGVWSSTPVFSKHRNFRFSGFGAPKQNESSRFFGLNRKSRLLVFGWFEPKRTKKPNRQHWGKTRSGAVSCFDEKHLASSCKVSPGQGFQKKIGEGWKSEGSFSEVVIKKLKYSNLRRAGYSKLYFWSWCCYSSMFFKSTRLNFGVLRWTKKKQEKSKQRVFVTFLILSDTNSKLFAFFSIFDFRNFHNFSSCFYQCIHPLFTESQLRVTLVTFEFSIVYKCWILNF